VSGRFRFANLSGGLFQAVEAVRPLQRPSAAMKNLCVLAVVALIASCHFDKLLTGGGGTPFSHDPPAGLLFGAGPGPAQAGQPLSPVVVTVVDSAGTRVAGADTLITIALGGGPSGAMLSGTVSAHAVNGAARFADLTIDMPGTGYTLTATVAGLKPDTSATFEVRAPPPTTGDLTVTTTTGGAGTDPNGYTVSVDGVTQSITVSGSVTYNGLTAGNHSVGLSGVATNCVVSGQNPRTVPVSAGNTAQTDFVVTCSAPANQPPTAAFTPSCNGLTCSFTSTSSDPDGTIANQQWAFGDQTTGSGANPSHTYGAGGTFTVALTVTDNQGAQDVVTHDVTVASFTQPPIVNAGPDQNPLVGVIGLTLDGASFSDPDHDGPWTVTINWGDGTTPDTFGAAEGSISGSHSYSTLLPHDYTLTITVVDGHGNVGTGSKTVHVHL